MRRQERAVRQLTRAKVIVAVRAAATALAGLLGLFAGPFGCRGDAAGQAEPALTLQPCVLEGAPYPLACGSLEVPRDSTQSTGPMLSLRVVRAQARGPRRRADPLFLLAGGPGQAASEAFGPLLPALAEVLRERDLVMIDQRGSGGSAPLDCAMPTDLPWLFRAGTLPEVALSCARALPHNPAYFSTAQAAADVDSVRQALGYQRVNLLGVSYGTRVAMRVAATYPDSVRSLVLDGVAPSELRIPLSFPRDTEEALDKVLARCAAEPACQRAYPHPRDDLAQTLLQLAREPAHITVRHPRTAESVELTLTRSVFAEGVRGLLYSPELVALLPLVLAQARGGDFSSFVAQLTLLAEGSQRGSSTGLSLSILCNEDLAAVADAELRAAAEGTILGMSLANDMRQSCANWPRARMPALAPNWRSDAPALTLSGELDPVTPQRWAELALTHLPHGQQLLVRGAAHGVLARGCVVQLVNRFLDAPDQPLDTSCTRDFVAPPFFIDNSGPSLAAPATTGRP